MFSMPWLLKSRYPLRLQIAALFSLLIMATGVVIIIFNHHQMSKLTELNTSKQYQNVAMATAAELDAVIRPIIISTTFFSSVPVSGQNTAQQRVVSLARMFAVLENNLYASAIYNGYDNGDFFSLRRLSAANRLLVAAPSDASWLVQSIEHKGGRAIKEFTFLDAQKQIISTLTPEDYDYQPRERDWYRAALGTTGLVTSGVYIFKSTEEAGITFSQAIGNQKVVVGIDVSLASLSTFIQRQPLPAGSEAMVLSQGGDVIATLDPRQMVSVGQPAAKDTPHLGINNPVLQALLQQWDSFTLDDNLRQAQHAGVSSAFEVVRPDGKQSWYGSVIAINNANEHYRLAVATPYLNLTTDVSIIDSQSQSVTLIVLLLSIPIVWMFSLKISYPLVRLRQDADAISNFNFDGMPAMRSAVAEIDDLNQSMSKMKTTIKNFISIGSMLAPGQDFILQMEGLLKETIDITTMSGGIIFLADSDGDQQQFTPCTLRWQHENFPITDAVPLAPGEMTFLNFTDVVQGKTVSGRLDQTLLPPSLQLWLLPHLPLRYVAVPMLSQGNRMLGLMLLLCPEGLTVEKENTKIALVNALVGGLSVSVETRRLLQEQKNLLNSFIELIAGAIDAKSEYTGGHCQRVPEISKMLAQAAVDATTGPFASFTMSVAEWEELHIASWLHDCGKITTPEFIVDKATKLEMIYDRIHEVRMRFEVLKREEEIAFLRTHPGLSADDARWEILTARLKTLDDDFYFVASSNLGGEFLSDEALARITQIAHYQWTRTLDDRAGISHVEQARLSGIPAPGLPVREALLADRPEHLIKRDKRDRLPQEFAFKIEEPEYLYNHGEIHNLSIRRGTLTEEDRYKINEHIMQTIIMLKKLPFPYTMLHVPEIAGGHHERIDGKGYPCQLTGDQMSVQARIMAIADVFEALTAADRPYKKGKLLSEALNIMLNMVNKHHLDAPLFQLFLESGVWREYAHLHLAPALIDAIDVPVLVAKIAPAAAD